MDRLHQELPSTANLPTAPPAVLLPYQREWVADPAPFKVMEKGRRTGVTWAEASDDVLIAGMDRSAGGQNVYYVGTDQEMTEEYIDACAMWAKAFNHAASAVQEGFWNEADEDKHIRTFTIRFPRSGNKIVALASRPRKLRGRQGVLVGDEAAFHDDLDALLKAAMAFLIWGGKVRLISTHDGEDNAFAQLVEDIRNGRQKGKIHRIEFREAVNQGLYQRVCMRMGKPWTQGDEAKWVQDTYAYYGSNADEELDAIPRQGGGTYLPRSLIERCMDKDLPVLTWRCKDEFTYRPAHERQADCQQWCEDNIGPLIRKLNPSAHKYYGSDFARSGDASVIMPGVEDEHLNLVVPFIIELRNVPFEQQKQVLAYVVKGFVRFMAGAMDARGNGEEMAEWAAQRWGTQRVAQIKATREWYRENMPRVKAAFEDGTIRLPKHADVLADLRTIKLNKGIASIPDDAREKGIDGTLRHGDIAIALVMLLHAIAELEPAPIEFQSSGARSNFDQATRPAAEAHQVNNSGWGSIPGDNDFAGYL